MIRFFAIMVFSLLCLNFNLVNAVTVSDNASNNSQADVKKAQTPPNASTNKKTTSDRVQTAGYTTSNNTTKETAKEAGNADVSNNPNDPNQEAENYDFNQHSFYITDEQLQEAQNINKIDDDNSDLDSKVINSSHFSSGTATKTWIPINKVQE